MIARAELLVLALSGLGCAVVTEFDPGRLAETTEAVCADGVDNDGNGLSDCQEFGCLDTQHCCVLPRVYLSDRFETGDCALDSCEGRDGTAPECIDPDRWQAWGSPYPTVCEGALVVEKRENCYEVGVQARQPLRMSADLSIVVGLAGRLAGTATRSVSLTLAPEIRGSLDPCAAIVPVEPILGVTAAAAPGGFQLAARYDREVVGTSPLVADEARHEVGIRFGDDLRVHLLLDGQEFAASPPDLPAPTAGDAYLVLAGVGRGARFTDVLVTARLRCDSPAEWAAAPQFLTLPKGLPFSSDWDGFEVGAPAAVAVSADDVDLYYVGCREARMACDPATGLGLGLARSRWDGPFVKETDKAPLVVGDLPREGTTMLDAGVVRLGDEVRLLVSNGQGIFLYRPAADGLGLEPAVDAAPVVAPGPSGAWDDAAVCSATAVAKEDGAVLLWYAAQSSADAFPTWRVGLATSTDGVRFDKSPASPVLREGTLEEFDGRGAAEPEVVYDPSRRLYRMWYGARAFLAGTSLGYAVSADGVAWHKFPGNPVLTPEGPGLETVGAPAVLATEGRLRLWLHGREPGSPDRHIYEVTNAGRDYAPP
ncbi:MAG: hypothetical protein HY906_11430 [Deltaproteobacteria bacterium]|nr:hypothetical protein [Deltaproteobacteria bacterium]